MKTIFKLKFRWEPEMVFFVVPTLTLGTYDSPNFGNEWPRVFGITFLWLKFQLTFEFRKKIKK